MMKEDETFDKLRMSDMRDEFVSVAMCVRRPLKQGVLALTLPRTREPSNTYPTSLLRSSL
jgi:hypothetical protein